MLTNEEREKITPMMRQYLEVKDNYPDCFLFYRLGDFYEMFFEDAIEASEILDLTLTGRDCGLSYRAPMCGLPYHAANEYIAKLIELGKKVAIAEQLDDGQGDVKLMKRDVIRVITPGTVLDNETLDDNKNNYIATIYKTKNSIGFCYADISTGYMQTTSFDGASASKDLDEMLGQLKPTEIVCNADAVGICDNLLSVRASMVPRFATIKDIYFSQSRAKSKIIKQFNAKTMSSLDLDDCPNGIIACGAMLDYLEETQKRSMQNLKSVKRYRSNKFMHLDISARKNLEIVENMTTHKRTGSLLGLLDTTGSCLGARKIRTYLENPSLDENIINARLDAVEEIYKNVVLRETTQDLFSKVCDIERICGKIAIGTVTPKDCYTLGKTLNIVPEIKRTFSGCETGMLKNTANMLVDVHALAYTLASAFNQNAPVNYKDGDFLNDGFNDKLDTLRNIKNNGKDWILKFEAKEKERTGIKNLKVQFNRVFGYYIEITKSNYDLIPENYELKQTIKDAQKFVTAELKETEKSINNAEQDALALELELFEEIKKLLMEKIGDLLCISDAIATLDALCSFARVSSKNNYVKPKIDSSVSAIKIEAGRHPVVENMLPAGQFVDNDTLLDNSENNILIITGPNMGGKSTYMRQVALITLMAHVGCFVPARTAEISLTDRIFTRIGASDELSLGNSTFMVEMNEMSNIINNATDKSLLILDEVGRGTSTFDGMSIAWAIIEYISKKIKAKTLFATHYHELTVLEGMAVGIKNYRVLVKEFNNSVIFLHKIARGSANRSFGIEVASLAGLPDDLISRAKDILKNNEFEKSGRTITADEGLEAPKLSSCAAEVINVLKDMDMNTITPIMAFGTLQNLVDKVKND
ncbi:MAG: DNA mismatch repair protein MutS [Clostridia bacterium]|nr:DNA mismatch repair protein MutS [Clostridia bacterium]